MPKSTQKLKRRNRPQNKGPKITFRASSDFARTLKDMSEKWGISQGHMLEIALINFMEFPEHEEVICKGCNTLNYNIDQQGIITKLYKIPTDSCSTCGAKGEFFT